MTDRFPLWHEAVEKRHMANLTFQEVRRAVQAVSAIYVERRGRIGSGGALDGAGKRAAFAMFYAPLHFLLVREIVRSLQAEVEMPATLFDLGCGTGAAGAAWALECETVPKLIGMDRNAWALEECRWTYRTLDLAGAVRPLDIKSLAMPANTAVLAAFTINEVEPETRDKLLHQFLKAAERGAPVLVIEPIARRLATWWDDWSAAFLAAGGRDDRWRFSIDLPERLRLMDRAAGLDHGELTGRSLWLPGSHARVPAHHVLPKMRSKE